MNLKTVAMCAACGHFYSSGKRAQCGQCGAIGTVTDVGYDEGPYRAAAAKTRDWVAKQPQITMAKAKRQLNASRRQLGS